MTSGTAYEIRSPEFLIVLEVEILHKFKKSPIVVYGDFFACSVLQHLVPTPSRSSSISPKTRVSISSCGCGTPGLLPKMAGVVVRGGSKQQCSGAISCHCSRAIRHTVASDEARHDASKMHQSNSHYTYPIQLEQMLFSRNSP